MCITRHHGGTYGIARHQQLRMQKRWVRESPLLAKMRAQGFELKVPELVSGWRRRS